MQTQKNNSNPRPFSVTLFAFGVLSIALINFFRAVFSISQWNFLNSLPGNISPLYMLIAGFIWSISGFILFFHLWNGRKGTRKNSLIYSVTLLFYYWIDQIFVMSNLLRSTNWFFLVLLSIVFLILSISMINRKVSKQYFGDMNE